MEPCDTHRLETGATARPTVVTKVIGMLIRHSMPAPWGLGMPPSHVYPTLHARALGLGYATQPCLSDTSCPRLGAGYATQPCIFDTSCSRLGAWACHPAGTCKHGTRPMARKRGNRFLTVAAL